MVSFTILLASLAVLTPTFAIPSVPSSSSLTSNSTDLFGRNFIPDNCPLSKRTLCLIEGCGSNQYCNGLCCVTCGHNEYPVPASGHIKRTLCSLEGTHLSSRTFGQCGYCATCEQGTYSPHGSGCIPCDAAAGNAYSTCPQQPTCNDGATYNEHEQTCACSPGFEYKNDHCSQCQPGYFSSDGITCHPCEAGSFSESGAEHCTTCPDGSIAPHPGTAHTCTPCEHGLTNNNAHTSCIPESSKGYSRKRSMSCGVGLTTCPIKTSRGKVGWECLDTQSNIQSCGGCWSTGEGVDCSDFDPLADAACVQGTCQYSCPKGYQLTTSGCEKISHGTHNATQHSDSADSASAKIATSKLLIQRRETI